MSQKCRILSAGIGRIGNLKEREEYRFILIYTTSRGAEIGRIQRPKRAQRIAEYIPSQRRGIGQIGHLKKG